MAMPKVEKKQQQMFISLKKPKWLNMSPNWQMNAAITKPSKEKSREESTGSAINRVTKITDEHTIIDWDLQKDLNYCECQRGTSRSQTWKSIAFTKTKVQETRLLETNVTNSKNEASKHGNSNNTNVGIDKLKIIVQEEIIDQNLPKTEA